MTFTTETQRAQSGTEARSKIPLPGDAGVWLPYSADRNAYASSVALRVPCVSVVNDLRGTTP
jgi:hypothetical protein